MLASWPKFQHGGSASSGDSRLPILRVQVKWVYGRETRGSSELAGSRQEGVAAAGVAVNSTRPLTYNKSILMPDPNSEGLIL